MEKIPIFIRNILIIVGRALKKCLPFAWPVLTFVMVGVITFSGVKIFNNLTHAFIFVEGESMSPTLSGKSNHADYGTMDTTNYAKTHINRFDIVITYYHDDYVGGYNPAPGAKNVLKQNVTYKIKRVYALPSEAISLTYSIVESGKYYCLSVTKGTKKQDIFEDKWGFTVGQKNRNISSYTTGAQEYYVMGDAWGSSSDSYGGKRVYQGTIIGVLQTVDGYGETYHDEHGKLQIKNLTPTATRIFKRY